MEYGQKNVIFRLNLEFNCKIDKWIIKNIKVVFYIFLCK